MRLVRQAAYLCLAIGLLRFVEECVRPAPAEGPPLLARALDAASLLWLSAALLGSVALALWVVYRVLDPAVPPPHRQAKPAKPERPITRDMQLRGWGFSLVAGWLVASVLVLVVMNDTGTGPFVAFATGPLGLHDFAGLVTFLIGLPVLLSPLVLLAFLPWQTRWPLLAGMQAAVKPAPRAPKRRRRR